MKEKIGLREAKSKEEERALSYWRRDLFVAAFALCLSVYYFSTPATDVPKEGEDPHAFSSGGGSGGWFQFFSNAPADAAALHHPLAKEAELKFTEVDDSFSRKEGDTVLLREHRTRSTHLKFVFLPDIQQLQRMFLEAMENRAAVPPSERHEDQGDATASDGNSNSALAETMNALDAAPLSYNAAHVKMSIAIRMAASLRLAEQLHRELQQHFSAAFVAQAKSVVSLQGERHVHNESDRSGKDDGLHSFLEGAKINAAVKKRLREEAGRKEDGGDDSSSFSDALHFTRLAHSIDVGANFSAFKNFTSEDLPSLADLCAHDSPRTHTGAAASSSNATVFHAIVARIVEKVSSDLSDIEEEMRLLYHASIPDPIKKRDPLLYGNTRQEMADATSELAALSPPHVCTKEEAAPFYAQLRAEEKAAEAVLRQQQLEAEYAAQWPFFVRMWFSSFAFFLYSFVGGCYATSFGLVDDVLERYHIKMPFFIPATARATAGGNSIRNASGKTEYRNDGIISLAHTENSANNGHDDDQDGKTSRLDATRSYRSSSDDDDTVAKDQAFFGISSTRGNPLAHQGTQRGSEHFEEQEPAEEQDKLQAAAVASVRSALMKAKSLRVEKGKGAFFYQRDASTIPSNSRYTESKKIKKGHAKAQGESSVSPSRPQQEDIFGGSPSSEENEEEQNEEVESRKVAAAKERVSRFTAATKGLVGSAVEGAKAKSKAVTETVKATVEAHRHPREEEVDEEAIGETSRETAAPTLIVGEQRNQEANPTKETVVEVVVKKEQVLFIPALVNELVETKMHLFFEQQRQLQNLMGVLIKETFEQARREEVSSASATASGKRKPRGDQEEEEVQQRVTQTLLEKNLILFETLKHELEVSEKELDRYKKLFAEEEETVRHLRGQLAENREVFAEQNEKLAELKLALQEKMAASEAREKEIEEKSAAAAEQEQRLLEQSQKRQQEEQDKLFTRFVEKKQKEVELYFQEKSAEDLEAVSEMWAHHLLQKMATCLALRHTEMTAFHDWIQQLATDLCQKEEATREEEIAAMKEGLRREFTETLDECKRESQERDEQARHDDLEVLMDSVVSRFQTFLEELFVFQHELTAQSMTEKALLLFHSSNLCSIEYYEAAMEQRKRQHSKDAAEATDRLESLEQQVSHQEEAELASKRAIEDLGKGNAKLGLELEHAKKELLEAKEVSLQRKEELLAVKEEEEKRRQREQEKLQHRTEHSIQTEAEAEEAVVAPTARPTLVDHEVQASTPQREAAVENVADDEDAQRGNVAEEDLQEGEGSADDNDNDVEDEHCSETEDRLRQMLLQEHREKHLLMAELQLLQHRATSLQQEQQQQQHAEDDDPEVSALQRSPKSPPRKEKVTEKMSRGNDRERLGSYENELDSLVHNHHNSTNHSHGHLSQSPSATTSAIHTSSTTTPFQFGSHSTAGPRPRRASPGRGSNTSSSLLHSSSEEGTASAQASSVSPSNSLYQQQNPTPSSFSHSPSPHYPPQEQRVGGVNTSSNTYYGSSNSNAHSSNVKGVLERLLLSSTTTLERR